MAILPGAQITMGDIVDNAFTLLKSSVDNIDAYTNNAENEYFNERTEEITGKTSATANKQGYATASLTLTFTGKPPVVTSEDFKAAWDAWIEEIGFTSKLNQLVTIKTLIQFLTALSMYVSTRFVIVTNPIDQTTARFFVANEVPVLTDISEMEPIKAADITTMLENIKDTVDSYKTQACNVSWGTLSVASCCSSSSSSSMYIAFYALD